MTTTLNVRDICSAVWFVVLCEIESTDSFYKHSPVMFTMMVVTMTRMIIIMMNDDDIGVL